MSTTTVVTTDTTYTGRRHENGWALAERHVTDLLAILKEMGARGIRVDRDRLAAFNETLDAEMARLQVEFDADPDLAPLRGFHPKDGYKKVPKDITGMEQSWFDGYLRWAKRKPFLATSSKQVLSYIRSRGHKVAQTKEGDDTSGQKALLLAWRKYRDDHYRKFVDYRKLKKLRGTYGEWPLQRRGDDYYVTTRFTLRPDNGRLSSLRPNVQNIPRDGELAERFKSCLVASPGHKLVRGDWTSAEALVTGWLASDPEYMRLARLGTHKFATAKFVGMPVDKSMTDDDLRPWLERAKSENKVLYRKIKTCIFGSNYLAGPRKIFEQNPEEFESQAEAKKFQQFCKGLSPKIGEWQRRTIAQATASKKLVNPFGYEKQFWDLPGGDGPSAVAFGPSSIIGFIARECILQLWLMETGKYLCWNIHDEMVADVPDERVEVARRELQAVMEQPWPELGGLSIGCEIKVSESMA